MAFPDGTVRWLRVARQGSGPARHLLLALAVQAAVLLATGFVAVFAPMLRQEPEFTARKTVYLPQRELEHRMSLSEFQQAATPALQLERLSTAAMLPDTVPQLPDLPEVAFSPFDRENPMQEAHALLGRTGLLGMLDDAGSGPSELSFLGVEDRAERMLILFDVSLSVKNKVEAAGMTMEVIRDEAAAVIRQLNANTLFGLVQFTRRYQAFRDYLVPATMDNKEAAADWLAREFRTTGYAPGGWTNGSPNGIQLILEAAFAMEPDVIILLSDANFYRDTPAKQFGETVPHAEIARDVEQFQARLEETTRLHFIGFQVREADRDAMSRMVRRYDGRYRDYR